LLSDRLKFSYQIDIEQESEKNIINIMSKSTYRDAMLQVFVNVSKLPDLELTIGPINVTDYTELTNEQGGENPSLEDVSSPDSTALIVVVTLLCLCCISGLVLAFIYKETCANKIEASHKKFNAMRERRREANRKKPTIWTVTVPILNVRNSPNINGDQIATKHEGDQLKIIEERPTNLYPNAMWLRLAHPIRGHRESWVISNVDDVTLLVKREEEVVENAVTNPMLENRESNIDNMISNPMLGKNQNNVQRKARSSSPPNNGNKARTISQQRNNDNRTRNTSMPKDTTINIRNSRAVSMQEKNAAPKTNQQQIESAQQLRAPTEPKPVLQMDFSIPRMRKPKRRPSSIKKK
jgi:hypothetical protein